MISRRPGALARLLAGVALTLAAPSAASANTADVFGLGSEAMARGGAMTAAADDYQSLFYNPAGLAGVERPTLTVGYLGIIGDLSYSAVGPSVDDGGQIKIRENDNLLMALTVPIGPLTLGAFLGTMPTTFMLTYLHEPSEPTFGYYTNRHQRMLLLLGGAVDLTHGVSVGLAVDVSAGLDGPAIASVGPTDDVEPSMFLGSDSIARLIAGVRWEVDEHLRLGINYRQEFFIPMHLAANSTVGDVPLTIDFTGHAMQTPHELSFGAAYLLGIADLSADFTYLRWSGCIPPWIAVDSNVTGIPIASPPPPNPFRDAYSVRLGADVSQDLEDDMVLHIRGGLRFETSMGVEQTQETNMLDGHKLGGAVGFGIDANIEGLPMAVDAHFDLTQMFDRTHTKAGGASSPYDTISGGGRVYTVGVTASLGLTR